MRRLVEENRLDPAAIAGSGRDGRVTKSDVVDFWTRGRRLPLRHRCPQPTRPPRLQRKSLRSRNRFAPPGRARGKTRRHDAPAATHRRAHGAGAGDAGASHLVQRSRPHRGAGAARALQGQLREDARREARVHVLFRQGLDRGAQALAVVNASVDGSDIVYHEYYDIGVAVSTERGLMVPIVRDADGEELRRHRARDRRLRRARAGTMAIEDLTGGTFTLTNGGVFGSLMSTPIVNAPQSAILGMHKIQERPMVVRGEIVARPMMYLALTYDHRIIDGRDAVQFLVAVKDCLEDPGRMLLQI